MNFGDNTKLLSSNPNIRTIHILKKSKENIPTRNLYEHTFILFSGCLYIIMQNV